MADPARLRTVEEISSPLEHYLIRVPAVAGEDVCTVCRGSVYDGYSVCFQCNEANRKLRHLRLDTLSFVSLAPAGEQLARDLYTYKMPNVPAHLRNQRRLGLAAVLWRWLSLHEVCLAASSGFPGFRS